MGTALRRFAGLLVILVVTAAAHYLNSRGVVAVNPEVGGCYLGPQADAHYIRMMTNAFKARGMGGIVIARPIDLGELRAFFRALGGDGPLDGRDRRVFAGLAPSRPACQRL